MAYTQATQALATAMVNAGMKFSGPSTGFESQLVAASELIEKLSEQGYILATWAPPQSPGPSDCVAGISKPDPIFFPPPTADERELWIVVRAAAVVAHMPDPKAEADQAVRDFRSSLSH